jgi:hemoglobin
MRESVYDAAGGAQGVLALAHAWHERCLADPVVSHAFEHGFADDHTERLAAYWGEQLGGPAAYSEELGDHSQVVRMHSGNGLHHEMDERAVACFAQAMDDAWLPDDPDLRATLAAWFRWGIGLMDAHPYSADDVPEDLVVPRWSWEGPVGPAHL